MAVRTNLVAVKGPQVAAVFGGSGSEGLPGSGNPGVYLTVDQGCLASLAVSEQTASGVGRGRDL